MGRFSDFLKRKDIVVSLKRYGIDAMSAMAQGLFCTLLVGTILNTLGTQFNIGFLTASVVTIAGKGYTIGSLASAMVGPAMAVAIGAALNAPGMERPLHRCGCAICGKAREESASGSTPAARRTPPSRRCFPIGA